jgi:hypothetical protein
MGQVLHGSATTTAAVRRTIQHSQASLRALARRYYYETEQLRSHLADFVQAYNFARRLKTLKGLTPYEHICQAWTKAAGSIRPRSNPSNAGTKHASQAGFWCSRQAATVCEVDRARKTGRVIQSGLRPGMPKQSEVHRCCPDAAP